MVDQNHTQFSTNGESTFWQRVYDTAIALLPKALWVSCLGLLLPQLWLSLGLGPLFSEKVEKIKQFTESALAGGPRDFYLLILIISEGGYSFLAWYLICLVAALYSYFSLIHMSKEHFSGLKSESPVKQRLLILGLVLRSGIWATAFVLLVFLTLQSLLPLLSILILPCFMVPVLITVRRDGIFKSLRSSLRLDYAERVPASKFSLFAQLCAFGAMFYLGFMLTELVGLQIIDLDQTLSIARPEPVSFFGNMLPYDGLYVLAHVVTALARTILLVILAIASVGLYYSVQEPRVETYI